jgi:hypothetical protein
MPTQNSGFPPAYGPGAQSDGSLLVDTEDGVNSVVPSFATGGTGQLSPAAFDPRTLWSSAGNVAPLNAILVELRVMNALLHFQLGATPLDLNQMRADEFLNSFYTTGQM